MTPTVISQETVIIDELLRKEAANIIDEACDSPLEGLSVTVDGTAQPLPDGLSRLLLHVLERTAEGGAITLKSMPEELTTTVAADVLGISRPTLMKLIASDEIATVKVGSHTRLRSADVLALRDLRSARRKQAFEELRTIEEQLGEN
ncbi:MAG TPA: helix-turn-helix domain-containing protein [Microbacteriaceae bacterium]|jgi:DNA binding domain, excisionase family